MQIAKYYSISYEKFFPNIGVSYANFRGNAKKTPINSDVLAILLTKYKNINATWLITGEGEMFLSEDKPAEISSDNELIEQLKEQISDKKKIIELQEETIKSLKEQIELLKRLKPIDVHRDNGAGCVDASGFSDK